MSKVLSWSGLSIVCAGMLMAGKAAALPPATDRPEEILRTEIITSARSPINGKPMTAQDYAQLEAQLEAASAPVPRSTLDPEIRNLIFLLQIRRTIRTFVPFFP